MKKYNPVFGVLFLFVVAVIFLAVNLSNEKPNSRTDKNANVEYYQYY
jgi:hypothetical protein